MKRLLLCSCAAVALLCVFKKDLEWAYGEAPHEAVTLAAHTTHSEQPSETHAAIYNPDNQRSYAHQVVKEHKADYLKIQTTIQGCLASKETDCLALKLDTLLNNLLEKELDNPQSDIAKIANEEGLIKAAARKLGLDGEDSHWVDDMRGAVTRETANIFRQTLSSYNQSTDTLDADVDKASTLRSAFSSFDTLIKSPSERTVYQFLDTQNIPSGSFNQLTQTLINQAEGMAKNPELNQDQTATLQLWVVTMRELSPYLPADIQKAIDNTQTKICKQRTISCDIDG